MFARRGAIGYIVAGAIAMVVARTATAQVENFRITEVDPFGDRVEVTNFGSAHTTTSAHPFAHEQNTGSNIPAITPFVAGAVRVFNITDAGGLSNGTSDIWLFRSAPIDNPANIVHGCKYGPAGISGSVDVAVAAGLWPDMSAHAPAPPPGMTLAWDGFGVDPKDWYIDETPTVGSADSTPAGTVPNSLNASGGTQHFENVLLGDQVTAIENWVIVNTSAGPGMFTVRAVNDVLGDATPRGGSTQWLRVRDQDIGNVQNRFYSSTITTAAPQNYSWTFFVNIEEPPGAGAATNPRLVIQHDDGGFQNAWGIELDDVGASLIVTSAGGTPASVPLFAYGPGTDIGDWIEVQLSVNFMMLTVSARINDGVAEALPIAPGGGFQKEAYRFCYRGEGTGNGATLLIDDITLELGGSADFDGDGDVDVTDFGFFAQCFGGPFNPPAVTCPAGIDTDLDGDGDVDVSDFGLFAQQFTGPI